MSYLIGAAQVLLAGICFGFLGIFGRLAFKNGMSLGELLSLRFTIAALILWLSVIIFRPRLIKLDPRQILISMALGIFGYAVFSSLYFKTIGGVSVPLAAMLLFTFPLFVNLGAHFILNEKMTKLQIISLLTASFGLTLLLWGDISVEKVSAIFYGLGAAIAYSIYVLLSGHLQKKVNPFSSSLYVIAATAPALWLYHQPSMASIQKFHLIQWQIIFGIAVVSTILPLTLFLAGLQKIGSARASILVMIEPVTAALAASALLNENLSQLQIIGALMVLSGALSESIAKVSKLRQ